MRRLFQSPPKNRLTTRLAAALPDEAHALSAAAMTAQSAGLGPAQVRVLGPALARASCAELMSLETELPQVPAPFVMQAPVWLFLLGALLGALCSVWLSGSVAMRTAPGVVAAVWATFGGIAGLLVGNWGRAACGLRRAAARHSPRTASGPLGGAGACVGRAPGLADGRRPQPRSTRLCAAQQLKTPVQRVRPSGSEGERQCHSPWRCCAHQGFREGAAPPQGQATPPWSRSRESPRRPSRCLARWTGQHP